MKAVVATPLEALEKKRLRDQIGRLFATLQEAVAADGPLAAGAWSPPVDVCETDRFISVRIELPGVSAEQIKIALTSTKLRIWGTKKKRPSRQRILSHLCSERSYGNFSRVVPLRWTISVREARAELVNGVLIVRLPKTRDRRGTEFRVPIKETN
jgi:HSP20 family protein